MVFPQTRFNHLMRSSESFTTALVRKAAQSHAGTQLFQNLFREKMTEIDSELRARGMASIAPEDGISVLPHVSSDHVHRSKSNRRQRSRYERASRRPAPRASRLAPRERRPLPSPADSSDEDVMLFSMLSAVAPPPAVRHILDSSQGSM